MTATALMFPGQGAQRVGMGASLRCRSAVARHRFEEASDVTGCDIAAVCERGPVEKLTETRICQPAVFTTCIAAFEVARDDGLEFSYVTGHSLGEYAALVAAGVLDFGHAVRLVDERARCTVHYARKAPGMMAAVLGASDDDVRDVCKRTGGVWAANFNCPGQVVISGYAAAVRDAIERLSSDLRVKVRTLAVEGAFHSPVMAPAVAKFRDVLAAVPLRPPQVQFISATTAAVESNVERIRGVLSEQIIGPVLFATTVHEANRRGVEKFVEIGPTPVLSGLVRRILGSSVPVRHIAA